MKQTDLTLVQLKTKLGEAGPWHCFYLNEIGEIMMADGEEALAAEETLRGLLDDGDWEKQYLALCWLSDNAANLSPETIQKIHEFKADPAHQEIVRQAAEAAKKGV